MNLIVRKNLAIALGIIFFVVIIACITWLCIVITDIVRYKTNTIPIFALNVSIEDTDTGYIETYKGVGYKYVEYSIKNKENVREFYLLGIKI